MTRAEAAKLGGRATSAAKAAAVAKNGRMPCALGKFRGRPKRYAHACPKTKDTVKVKAGVCPYCGEAVPGRGGIPL